MDNEILTRDQFKTKAASYYLEWTSTIFNDEEPFWIPEYREGYKANYFMITQCVPLLIGFGAGRKHYYWAWCRDNMNKPPLCFMSNTSTNVEWWGFHTEEDMLIWMLKWT